MRALQKIFIFTVLSIVASLTAAQDRFWTSGAYANNARISTTLEAPGAVSFDYAVVGTTEAKYDLITVTDGLGKVLVNKASGNIAVYGNSVGSVLSIIFTSDGSITNAGVSVTITPRYPSSSTANSTALVTGVGSTTLRQPEGVTQNFRGVPPTLSLTNLPGVLRALNAPTAATWMDRWFYGDGSNLIVDLNEITSNSWEATKASRHWDDTTSLFQSQNTIQRTTLIDNLRRTNNSAGKNVLLFGGSFDHISAELTSLGTGWKDYNSEFFTNNSGAANGTYHVADKKFNAYDDVPPANGVAPGAAAIGRGAMRAVPAGRVVVNGTSATIYVERLGVYFKDSYDFIDTSSLYSDPLGCWRDNPPSFGGVTYSSDHKCVNNRSFRDWKLLYPWGGRDYRIISKIREVTIGETMSFTYYFSPAEVERANANPHIAWLFGKHQDYFGAPGQTYSVDSSWDCQNFSNSKMICANRSSPSGVYWFDGIWRFYGNH